MFDFSIAVDGNVRAPCSCYALVTGIPGSYLSVTKQLGLLLFGDFTLLFLGRKSDIF